MTELKQYEPEGYNPSTGIYASSYIFTGNWDNELANLKYTPRTQESQDETIRQSDDDKGIHSGYLYNSFKSATGESTFHDTLGDDFWKEDVPSDFSYTDSYFASPKLAAICDWFQCEKARVRIFRQQPGQNLQLHHDFDNERHSYNKDHTMVRILMPLNDDRDSYVNLANSNSDAMVKLEKGQFAIINTDFVWHGTVTYDNRPRDMLNMIVKWNDWLHDLTRPKSHVAIERITL